MGPKSALCVVLGHKWAPAEETNEADLTMRCKRCGRATSFGSETHGLPTVEQKIRPRDQFGNRLP